MRPFSSRCSSRVPIHVLCGLFVLGGEIANFGFYKLLTGLTRVGVVNRGYNHFGDYNTTPPVYRRTSRCGPAIRTSRVPLNGLIRTLLCSNTGFTLCLLTLYFSVQVHFKVGAVYGLLEPPFTPPFHSQVHFKMRPFSSLFPGVLSWPVYVCVCARVYVCGGVCAGGADFGVHNTTGTGTVYRCTSRCVLSLCFSRVPFGRLIRTPG